MLAGILLALPVAVFAAGDQEQSAPVVSNIEGEWTLAKAARPYQGTTIKFMRHPGFGETWMRNMIPAFEAETGIKVEMEVIGTLESHRKRLLTWGAGQHPWDVHDVPDFWFIEYAKPGWLLALNPLFADPNLYQPDFDWQDFSEFALKVNTYEGQLYTLPGRTNTDLFYYRKDLLADAGLSAPLTWAQHLEMAEKLHRPAQEQYAIASAFNEDLAADNFVSLLHRNGGSYLDADNRHAAFNTPAGIEALEHMKKLLEYSAPGALNYGWGEPNNLMAEGKAVTMRNLIFFPSVLEDPEKSSVAGNVGYGAVPAGRAGSPGWVSTWANAIDAESQHPEASYLFIQFLYNKENLADFVEFTKGGILPGRMSLQSDPALVARYPHYVPAGEGIKNGWARPQIEVHQSVWETLGKEVQAALSGVKSSSQALSDAAATVEKKLAEFYE
jgi:multiple sugar transport system substrate-binding protein